VKIFAQSDQAIKKKRMFLKLMKCLSEQSLFLVDDVYFFLTGLEVRVELLIEFLAGGCGFALGTASTSLAATSAGSPIPAGTNAFGSSAERFVDSATRTVREQID